ncbi:MAG: hypothetical protein U0T69_11005 [Chitinophagales bacterium]
MKNKEVEIIKLLLKGFFSKINEFSDLEYDSLKYICEGYYREFIEKLKIPIESEGLGSIEVQRAFICYFFKNHQRFDFFKPDLDLSKDKMKSKTNTSFLRLENEKMIEEDNSMRFFIEILEGKSDYSIDDVEIEIYCPKAKDNRIKIINAEMAKSNIEYLAFLHQFFYSNMTISDKEESSTSYLDTELKRYKSMKEDINVRKKIIADAYIQYFGVKAENKRELYYNVLVELGWIATEGEFELKFNETKNPNKKFDFISYKTNQIERILKTRH